MFKVQPITAQQVGKLKDQLGASGTTVQLLEINKYQIIGHGITANAIYDETLGSLNVTVVHKPFFIPESAIQSGILEAMKK